MYDSQLNDSQATWTRAVDSIATLASLVDHVVANSDGATATAWLADLQLASRRLDAARLRLVGLVDRSGVWSERGYLSPASYLRHELRVDHTAARTDLRASQELARLPHLAAALAAGLVSRAAVDRIISVGTRNPTRESLLPHFEEVFTDIAATQPFALLVRALTQWAEQVDPQSIIDGEDRAHSRRYLNLTRYGDGWLVDGFLTIEQGTAVAAALNATIAKTRRGAESKTDNAGRPNDDFSQLTDLPQAPGQARADALADLAMLACSAADLPDCGGIRPTVIVTVPLDRLQADCTEPVLPQRRTAASHGTPGCSPLPDRLPERAFEDCSAFVSVSNGPGTTLVSARTAQRLACDCTIHRLVLNPDGMPLDVGRATRVIGKHLRIALNQRDKGCVYPGCERPPGWTEAHHLVPWSDGGSTSIENLALLCSRHHHMIHESSHTITMTPEGRPKITKRRW
ncbi:MAG: DUF222 domain-containing protein [Actinomycetes bacterium]